MSQRTDTNESTERDVHDVTIVGAGPAGLFAAFYAGMRGMKTKIVETLNQVGGQLVTLYPEKYVYDVAGHPRILAKELADKLRRQAYQFKPSVCLGEKAEDLEYVEDGTIKLTTDKDAHYTRALIVTTGIGPFEPRKLNRPQVNRLEGKGVSYYGVEEQEYYQGKDLLIVGGGDSAVDWALNLKDVADSITLVHRRDVFRAHESSVTDLLRSEVEVKLFWELESVSGEDHIEEATIFNNETDEKQTLDVDEVLIFIGYKAGLGPLDDWGLEVERKSILIDGKMRTNLPGVYAAGDVAMPKRSEKLNLIAVGFGQAAIAVNCSASYIHPEERVMPGHSSDMEIFGVSV